jgi:hypothetical protein
VGQCPSCGATFRVGETATSPAPRGRDAAEPRASIPQNVKSRPQAHPGYEDEWDRPLTGYGVTEPTNNQPVEDDAGTASPQEERPKKRGKAEAKKLEPGPVGRGGLFALPSSPESTFLGSLKYPLWDGFGLAVLLIWPIPMTVLSLIVFGVLPMALWGEDRSMLALAPITLGFVVVFLFAVGYVLAALGNILVASARGEIHHPRWPDVDFGTILGSVLRWAAALGAGLAITWWPAQMYSHAQNTGAAWIPRALSAEILALGGPIVMVSLLSIYLHDSLFAIDPRLVFPAIFQLGLRLLGPMCLLLGLLPVGVFVVACVYESARFGFGVLLMSTWLAWIYGLYASMVVVRATGRAYQRKAKSIGWFRTKRRRVELPIETVPAAPAPDL